MVECAESRDTQDSQEEVGVMSHQRNDTGPCDGAVRLHYLPDRCPHRGRDVCQKCAGLTDDEMRALRAYFDLLNGKNSTTE